MNIPASIATVVVVEAGTTILIPSGPVGDHLFVTVFDVKKIDGKLKVLLVPIESQIPKFDNSCVLSVGDHEFIKHPSFIGYNHCRIEDLSHVINCINAGTFKIKYAATSAKVLEQIRVGYKSSKRVPRYIKNDWGNS